MNDTAATLDTGAVVAATAAAIGTFPRKFNFKAIDKETYEGLFDSGLAQEGETREAFYARIAPQYEFVGVDKEGKVTDTKKYAKRRSTEVQLTDAVELNELANSGVAPTVVEFLKSNVQQLIADFAKSQFIDLFLPLGSHTLADLIKFQAASGNRGGGFSIDEDTLKAALESFQLCMTQALGQPKGAELLTTIARGRFTASSLSRGGLTVSEETVKKLQNRVDQWGLWLNETNPQLAEEYSIVHTMWSTNLDKLTKKESAFNLDDIL